MRHFIHVIPLLFAMVLNMGVALAQTDMPAIPSTPEWFSIFASQGLAVVLVFWWIAKGYPAWLKQWSEDLAKQREEFHGWRREIADDVRNIRTNMDARPCLLSTDATVARLVATLNKEEK